MLQNLLRKFLPHVVLAFLLCLFVSGCSPSPISENKLLSYVEQDDPMDNRLPLYDGLSLDIQYHDLTVDKRLTDKDAKSDQVWIHFTADTETDTVDVEARMDFTLYNDGWILDNVEVLSTNYSPLTGPRHDMVGSYLGEQYDYYQYQYEEVDLENKCAKLYYKVLDEYTYMSVGRILCVNYYYAYAAPYWDYGEIELIEETRDWRMLCGVWTGESMFHDTCALAIRSITDTGDTISLDGEAELRFVDVLGRIEETLTSSDITLTCEYRDLSNGDDCYLCIRAFYGEEENARINLYFHPDRASASSGLMGMVTWKIEQTTGTAFSSLFYDEFFDDDAEIEMGDAEKIIIHG